jgi:hypothetical protein
MYIFGRSREANPQRYFEAAEAAVELAHLVGDMTGMQVSVFASRYGEPIQTIRWSTRADSQSELQTNMDKMAGDKAYRNWWESHADLFIGSTTSTLTSVVSAANVTPVPRRFYTILTATAANGRYADAVAFGVKAQQFVAEATGLTTMFATSVYGPFGTVGWLTGADDGSQLDELMAMQTSNPGYHALVAEAADLFIPASGMTGLIEKIG